MAARKRLSVSGLTFATAFAVAFALFGATTASARIETFVDSCLPPGPQPIPAISRANAMNLTLSAQYEGYEWGGGCWNDNNIDDSPNDPPSTFAGGEGPDCSGLVFKAWMLGHDASDPAMYFSSNWRNDHGPYTTGTFRNGTMAAVQMISKSSATFADAFVSKAHMGLVFARNADGTDLIFEAKGEAYGTNIWTRTYRGTFLYKAIRRRGWL
jgi:hypothetical protein